MSLSLFEASVPAFERSLTAFLGVLDKAEAHAKARKFDAANYLAVRLIPDMWPLTRQIQAFCDHAKNAAFRLAGAEPPAVENRETTIAELRARIQATLEHLKTVDSAAVDAAADRDVVFPLGPAKMKMQGANYLLHFALPNFYFHLTTAYDILRAGGVEIGKRDFLGAVPGLTPARTACPKEPIA